MSIDVIADFCTILRNAIMVRKRIVSAPFSSYKENILKVLQTEGYIKGYQVVELGNNKKAFNVSLKYVGGIPAITEIKSISTAGSRVYCEGDELRPFKNGFGIKILSTNRGVMSDNQIRALRENGSKVKLGGEVVCSIW